MKTKKFLLVVVVLGLGLALVGGPRPAQGQGADPPAAPTGMDPEAVHEVAANPLGTMGTAFTYQGRLENAGGPVDGVSCDLIFTLCGSSAGSDQIGSPQPKTAAVQDGFFTVNLDFGANAFNGQERWLKIEVRCPAGAGAYAALTPRQQLTPAPYALNAPLVVYNPNNQNATAALSWYNDGAKDWPRIRYGGSGQGATNGFLIQGQGDAARLAVLDDGAVGVGTQDPQAKLHVAAGAGERAIYLSGGPAIGAASLSTKWNLPPSSGDGTLPLIASGWDTAGGIGFIQGNNVSSPVVWMYASAGRNAFTVASKTYGGTGEDVTSIDNYLTPLLQVRENGKVGIGTTNPTLGKLEVYNGAIASSGASGGLLVAYNPNNQGASASLSWYNDGTKDWPRIRYGGSGQGATNGLLIQGAGDATRLAILDNGNVGIGTIAPQKELDVNGTTRTEILQITGGSDLAEPFEVAGEVQPGLVVAIDPDHPGQLRIADRAYDRMVAGCVSGAHGINPGLVMQQEGTAASGAFPVALSGRVYCWADASYGPIHPGDLLTTSATPGHLMAVTDYEQAQGAIAGKAMTGLETGRGLILVLVTLQ
jgi:hypothetical protein